MQLNAQTVKIGMRLRVTSACRYKGNVGVVDQVVTNGAYLKFPDGNRVGYAWTSLKQYAGYCLTISHIGIGVRTAYVDLTNPNIEELFTRYKQGITEDDGNITKEFDEANPFKNNSAYERSKMILVSVVKLSDEE